MAPQVLSKETEKKNRPIQEKGDNERQRHVKTNQEREEKCVKRAIEERKREEVC